ncbi:MAG: hypothetical protein ACLQU3_31270 [Limisphaerales bacterium]|jgi:hypothetical protein
MNNGKQRAATELEAELVRLNLLVRERRRQLVRLDKCPNKDCPCRFVWREQVEKNLAGQVGEVRRQVRGKPAKLAKPKDRPSRRPAASGLRRRVGRQQQA